MKSKSAELLRARLLDSEITASVRTGTNSSTADDITLEVKGLLKDFDDMNAAAERSALNYAAAIKVIRGHKR